MKRLILLIALLGFVLRLFELGRQSLWFDETFSVIIAGVQWPVFWAALLTDGVHPPGYYLLLRGWLLLAGSSEFAVRFPSVVAGTLAIPLMYRLGRAFHSRSLGLAAAALLAVNPFALWYAQEGRMYSLLLVLVIASAYAFWQLLRRPQFRWWLLLTLTTAAGFYCHYFAFAFSLVQFLVVLITFKQTHRVLRWWALAQGAALLPFLPWAWAVAQRQGGSFGINWIPAVRLLDLPLTLANLAFALSAPPQPLTWLGLLLAVGAIGAGTAYLLKSKKRTPVFVWFLLLWLLLPPAALWLMSLKQPLYVDRYFILSLPALLLLMATVALLPRRRAALALTVLLVAGTAASLRLFVDPSLQKEAWRTAAARIRAAEQPHDALVMDTMQTSIPFGYYYRGSRVPQIASINDTEVPLKTLIGDSRRVWLVFRRPFRPTHKLTGSEPYRWRDVSQADLKAWLQNHQADLATEVTLPGVYILRVDLH